VLVGKYTFVRKLYRDCLQLEKVLQQGDISEVTEPYMKDEKVCKGFEVSTKWTEYKFQV